MLVRFWLSKKMISKIILIYCLLMYFVDINLTKLFHLSMKKPQEFDKYSIFLIVPQSFKVLI